jgi:hypothetical protein
MTNVTQRVITERIKGYDVEAPLKARAAMSCTTKLFYEILDDPLLNRENILATTAVFSTRSSSERSSESSLGERDCRLADVASQFALYLADMKVHLTLLLLMKTEMKQEFGGIEQLINDIDAVQQHLVGIPFEIIQYHKEHGANLRIPVTPTGIPEPQGLIFRQLALNGHKNWLIYEVGYIKSAMQSITRLYQILTEGKK